jgi:uncharacterized membrane-anchored protein YitT (DUF2179 family)
MIPVTAAGITIKGYILSIILKYIELVRLGHTVWEFDKTSLYVWVIKG